MARALRNADGAGARFSDRNRIFLRASVGGGNAIPQRLSAASRRLGLRRRRVPQGVSRRTGRRFSRLHARRLRNHEDDRGDCGNAGGRALRRVPALRRTLRGGAGPRRRSRARGNPESRRRHERRGNLADDSRRARRRRFRFGARRLLRSATRHQHSADRKHFAELRGSARGPRGPHGARALHSALDEKRAGIAPGARRSRSAPRRAFRGAAAAEGGRRRGSRRVPVVRKARRRFARKFARAAARTRRARRDGSADADGRGDGALSAASALLPHDARRAGTRLSAADRRRRGAGAGTRGHA